MTQLPCGSILMSNIITVEKTIKEENNVINKRYHMNYTYHHLVDTTNDNRRKTELFNHQKNS